MTHQGTSSLIDLSDEGRELAPHLLEFYDFKRCANWMIRAADALERLAPLDPEIEVVKGEH